MELFLASLAQAAAAVAKSRKSKMLTAAHLCVERGRSACARGCLLTRAPARAPRSKAAVHADATLDFLKDAVAKAPELPAAAEGDDSDAEGAAKPKRVRKPRRARRVSGDDVASLTPDVRKQAEEGGGRRGRQRQRGRGSEEGARAFAPPPSVSPALR